MGVGEGCPGYPVPTCRRLYWRGVVYRRSHRGVYRWGSYASLSSGNVLRARYLVLVFVLVLGNVQRSRMLCYTFKSGPTASVEGTGDMGSPTAKLIVIEEGSRVLKTESTPKG